MSACAADFDVFKRAVTAGVIVLAGSNVARNVVVYIFHNNTLRFYFGQSAVKYAPPLTNVADEVKI